MTNFMSKYYDMRFDIVPTLETFIAPIYESGSRVNRILGGVILLLLFVFCGIMISK